MDLFFVFLFFAIGSVAIVLTLTAIVLNLLKHISELENELEANLPPF